MSMKDFPDAIDRKNALKNHYTKEDKIFRKLCFASKDLRNSKYPRMIEIQVSENQQFLIQRLEGKGKLLTSQESFEMLKKLVDLYVREDKVQKRSFMRLFKKFILKKIQESVFEKSVTKKVFKPFEFKLKGKVHSYYEEPVDRKYIKQALAKIDRELRLPADENSEIFIDQLSEFTDNISETSIEDFIINEKED